MKGINLILIEDIRAENSWVDSQQH